MPKKQNHTEYINADELIYELENASSPVRYILAEGKDDDVIYGNIIARMEGFSQPPIRTFGGRSKILSFIKKYKKLNFPNKKNHELLFFADKDTWVFTDIPKKYSEIHFTEGYSIENDLFQDGKERLLGDLLSEDRVFFNEVIDSVVDWFAFECEKLEKIRRETPNTNSDFDKITGELLQAIVWHEEKGNLMPSFLQERAYQTPSNSFLQIAKNQPCQVIRGKYLFSIYQETLKKKKNIQINVNAAFTAVHFFLG